jgi:hypothetical protein
VAIERLGLFFDVLAITGARGSQVSRLTVADLIPHSAEPKLMMPKSAKGGGGRSQPARELRRDRRADALEFLFDAKAPAATREIGTLAKGAQGHHVRIEADGADDRAIIGARLVAPAAIAAPEQSGASAARHSDQLSRRALLYDEPPVVDNVVALAR